MLIYCVKPPFFLVNHFSWTRFLEPDFSNQISRTTFLHLQNKWSCDVSCDAVTDWETEESNLVNLLLVPTRKALSVHCDSSRQKEDKGKPNILVSFVSNIAALRLMWHHNFSLSNFEEMMAFKRLFLVYKVHFFSFEQDLLLQEDKEG